MLGTAAGILGPVDELAPDDLQRSLGDSAADDRGVHGMGGAQLSGAAGGVVGEHATTLQRGDRLGAARRHELVDAERITGGEDLEGPPLRGIEVADVAQHDLGQPLGRGHGPPPTARSRGRDAGGGICVQVHVLGLQVHGHGRFPLGLTGLSPH